MTTPNHPRADRIHAIWKRRTTRFRDAHYAYHLAYELAERVGRDHPTYQQARDLVRQAARRMDILNRQTMRLARLEIAAVGIKPH